MESKVVVAVPESNSSPSSGSSSSFIPIRASPSNDSDNFDTINNKNKGGSSSSSTSSGSSSSSSGGSSKSDDDEEEEDEEEEEGSFVSGDEEFEAALERPVVAEVVEREVDEEEVDETFVEAVDRFVMPIAKVSSEEEDEDEDDENEDVEESPKVGVFKAEDVGELGGSFSGGGGDIGSNSVVSGIEENYGGGPVVSEAIEGVVEQKKDDDDDAGEKPVILAGLYEQFKSYMSELVGPNAGVEDAAADDKTAIEYEPENVSVSVNHSVGLNDSKTAVVEDEIKSETAREADESEGVDLTPEGDTIVEKILVDTPEPGAVVVGHSLEKKAAVTEAAAISVEEGIDVDNGFDEIAHDAEEPTELKLSGPGKDENEDIDTVPAGASPKASQDNPFLDGVNGEEKLETVTEPEPESDAETKEPLILSCSRDIGSNGGEIEGVDTISQSAEIESETFLEAEDEISQLLDQDGDNEGDSDNEGMIFGSSEAARKFMEELEQGSGAESAHELSERIDGQIVTDSDGEVDTDEEGEGNELFDSAALTALLKAATGAGSDSGNITITSQDGSRLFSVERPAGLGSSLRSVKPIARSNGSKLLTPSLFTSMGAESETTLTEEEKKNLEKIQQLRVKFLRIVQRLGHSVEDNVAAQVLYRLSLIAGRPTSPIFSLEVAKETAMTVEAGEKSDLDFSLTILVLGKAGVGKSATINSMFGEEKTSIDAFDFATTTVKEITGMVDGVKVRVFDTPGLKSSVMEQAANQKILAGIKKFTKKCPPDIVLYVDRLDTQTRDLNDLPLLRSITASLGPSIWRSVIVTLTHGSSAPPDGSSGSPLSYEVFVAQRSHVVQQLIGQAVGDLRLMSPSLMNPVSLVENHQSCRKSRDGQKVLPNGQTWRPQLLLLCYSMKILSDANALSKPQDSSDHRKLFGFRTRSPPLPYLLSWLLQSRTHPKLPSDQGADMGDSDIDLDDLSDSDVEDGENEYDQLPPFKPLKKSQLEKLSKEQKKAYLEEYDYRVKLLQKKQWREELIRMRESKKRGKVGPDEYGYNGEDMEQEDGGPAAVPVALPDMALPPSFDSDNPAYRYRFLEPTSQLLMRPVLDTHGWDHDCGYDGVNLEQSLAIANRFPAAVVVQVTKDKKEFNIHLDSSVAAKHGENNSSMAGFDIQNVGKQLAYILRGETKFKLLKRNTTSAGFSVTFLGENIASGLKLEDQLTLGKRLVLVGSTGTVRSQSDAAYGANLEVRLRESDFPIGQDQSTLGLSLVKWRGDLALGANLQSQFSVGRSSKMAVRVGLNNKLSGQITVRTTSSDQLQIALMGLLPVVMTVYKTIWPVVGENNSIY